MADLKWILSYQLYKFDTPDGDLDRGQYAVAPHGGFYVRRHPKNNFQIVRVEKLSEIDTKEVQILPNEWMCFDEFELPNGRRFRRPSTLPEYRSLAVKNAGQPVKNMTAVEIANTVKDDSQWLRLRLKEKESK